MAKVYCLVRTKKSVAASARLENVLAKNHLLDDITAGQCGKIAAMSYNVHDHDRLGLAVDDYEILRRSVTTIIHNAWAVNFNMKFRDFEPHCRGTSDLINLALSSSLKKAPDFVFVSTLGAVYQAKPIPIREKLYGPAAATQSTNYALSKWTTEQICFAAVEKAGLSVRLVRLAQICGDLKYGMWNVKEAWPQTIAAAQTIGAIPASNNRDEQHHWLPSDVAGAVIADLALLDQVDRATRASVPVFAVFHVANPKPILWKAQILSSLRRHGLDFETLPWPEWVVRLESSDTNVLRNPPYRLINFYKLFALGAGGTQDTEATAPGLIMDISNACKISPRLREGAMIDEVLIGKFLQFWKSQLDWAGQAYPAKM